MPTFRLRTDLERVRLGRFALPLGIEPVDRRPPAQGFTVLYNPGEDGEPDTYSFHVVVSHEKLRDLVRGALSLLPERVSPIVEIDSYDAYRTVDVYIGREDAPLALTDFVETWTEFEPVLLEDAAVGAGANSDEPFIEIFLDQWKGLSIHVPPEVRDKVEFMLREQGLDEVPATWPTSEDQRAYDATIRPVLDASDESLATLDDVVLELRRRWNLELNVDPESNVDDAGKELGLTLWNAALVVEDSRGSTDKSAYMQVWASARSLSQLEQLIDAVFEQYPEWSLYECYAVTRVAYDDRPEELEHLKPRRTAPEVHLVQIFPNEEQPEQGGDGGGGDGGGGKKPPKTPDLSV
jgi:hypothetical protein